MAGAGKKAEGLRANAEPYRKQVTIKWTPPLPRPKKSARRKSAQVTWWRRATTTGGDDARSAPREEGGVEDEVEQIKKRLAALEEAMAGAGKERAAAGDDRAVASVRVYECIPPGQCSQARTEKDGAYTLF